MKAHHYLEKGIIFMNDINFLFIPDKKIVICLGPKKGKITFPSQSKGGFGLEDRIKIAQKIVDYDKKGKQYDEDFEYIGEIDLSKESIKKIDSIMKEYQTLEMLTKELGKNADKERKNISNLVKEQYPKSFT